MKSALSRPFRGDEIGRDPVLGTGEMLAALDALGADVEETSALEALQDGLFEIADLAGLFGED